MQLLIRMPKDFIQRSVLMAVTLVNMSACTVNADEQMIGPTPSSQEPVTNTERPPVSSEAQFRKIQTILGEIETVSETAQSETSDNANVNEPVQDAAESSSAIEAARVVSETLPNKSPSAMGKRERKHGMSSSDSPSVKQSMGKCKGMMCNKMMNRSMMGQKTTPDTTAIPTDENLPGYAEAPHLYHLGEVAFFLDHTQPLALSNRQVQSLTLIKTQWMAQQNEINSQISTLEQALWTATSMGKPDITTVRNTISDIEALNGQLRLASITRVGQAVTVLTADQVDLLMSKEQLP